MASKERYFTIYIYGPESDYIYEPIEGITFKSVNKAKEWISFNVPRHIGYKIVKVETVLKKSPLKPHYLY